MCDIVQNDFSNINGKQRTTDASVSGTSITVPTEDISYRPITMHDIDDIVMEYDRIWGVSRNTNSDDNDSSDNGHDDGYIRLLLESMESSRTAVLRYLNRSTHGEIAEKRNGQFLGVILSRINGEKPLFTAVPGMMASMESLMKTTNDSIDAINDASEMENLEGKLDTIALDDAGNDAEVVLFIVNSEARGHGVGGTLWNHQMTAFENAGISSYHLHTDNDCNTGFYDHIGMRRIVSLDTVNTTANDDSCIIPDRMYVYEGTVPTRV